MITSRRHGPARRLSAVLGAVLLALVGLLVPASAGAADPTWDTTADVTAATAADGLKVQVTGSAYTNLPPASTGAPASGVYAGLWNTADSLADIAADNSLILGTKFLFGAGTTQPNWSTEVAADAADLDPDANYQIIVWVAHGNPTADTVLATVPLGLTVAQKQALFPGWTPPVYTTTVDVTAASAADGLQLHVEGTGYAPLPNASTGSPASGVYASLRNPADSLADIAADNSILPAISFIWNGNISGGAWSTDLTADAADLDPDVDYEILVWVAHGNPTAETVLDTVPVTLSAAEHEALFPGSTPTTTTTTTTVPPSDGPWNTTVAVTGADATDGLKLAVNGTGFTNLPRSSTGAPSQGVYAALRDPATMSFAQINADNSIVPAVAYIPNGAISGGSWSTTLSAAASDLDPDADYEVIVWVAHGDVTDDTVLDTVPVTLSDAQREALFPGGVTPPPTTTPPTTTRPGATPPPTTAAPATQRHATTNEGGLRCVTETTPGTAGSPQLSWGVRSSFVNYIEGGIAKGSIDTGGGVVRSGDGFTWPNGTGEVSDAGQGTWTFHGFVHFSGHNGVLDTTLANLRVEATGASTGRLVADVQSQDMDGNDVSGANMAIAELHFSSISPSGASATATLTADGALALNSMYEPGESLDPVTVTVSGASAGSSVENCYDAQGNLVSSTPVSGTAGSGGGLPATGFGALRLAATGMMMLIVGMLALAITTRRRRAHVSVK